MRLLAVGILLAVVLGLAESWYAPLATIGAFRLHLSALAAVVLAAAVAWRTWTAALPAAVALALAALNLGPVWQEAERAGAGEGQRIRLVYANVYVENALPDAMQAALVAADADIIVAVETPRGTLEQPEALARHFPYSVVSDLHSLPVMSAIWSRFPVEWSEVNMNDHAGPVAAMAVLRIDERTRLSVIGGHFDRGSAEQSALQVQGIERMAARMGPPLVIVADFNAALWSERLSEVARRTGTEPATGYRVTWRGRYPGGLPAPWGHQIDHLLASPGIGIAALETMPVPGSDHLALVAELLVPPESAVLTAGLSAAGGADYLARGAR